MPTQEAMRVTAFEYIEVFYNRKRLHSILRGIAPPSTSCNIGRQPRAATRRSHEINPLGYEKAGEAHIRTPIDSCR